MIRAAKYDEEDSLSLLLAKGTGLELVNLAEEGTDILTGLVLKSEDSPADVTIDGGGRVIALTGEGKGSVITVGSGVKLTLKNITFVGKNDNNVALIKVEKDGTLVLEDGAVITGNTNTNNTTNNGGGVWVAGGTLVLEEGAVIKGNTSVVNGGGVSLTYAYSTFTMRGGTINGNTADKYGGGIYVSGSYSTITMSGGTISGNITTISSSTSNGGGGVYVGNPNNTNNTNNTNSMFTMSGGTISGNTAEVLSFNDGDGYKNGSGGVYVSGGDSTFTMNGGTISGNKALNGYGGGVYAWVSNSSSFKKEPEGESLTSGVIYGKDEDNDSNTATTGEGHAVFITNNGKALVKKRDATVAPDTALRGGVDDGWDNA
jgi:hypothetical protein